MDQDSDSTGIVVVVVGGAILLLLLGGLAFWLVMPQPMPVAAPPAATVVVESRAPAAAEALPVEPPAVPAVEETDALRRLLKAVKDHEEPKRDSVFAFPQALKILSAPPPDAEKDIGRRGMHTYSTNLTEAKLVKEFGKPDETATETISMTGPMGSVDDVNSKMIRYGWLRIYVRDNGEIWYVARIARK